MKKSLTLNIVDSHREIFQGEVESVTVSGTLGGLTFMAGHSPLISTLKPGEIHYTPSTGELESLFVYGGIVEVQPYLVTVLADAILRSDELDAAAAEASLISVNDKIKSVEIGTKAHKELMREMHMMRALLELSRKTSKHRLKHY